MRGFVLPNRLMRPIILVDNQRETRRGKRDTERILAGSLLKHHMEDLEENYPLGFY